NPEDSLKIAQNIEKNSKKESDFIAKVQDAEESSFQPEIQELNDLEPENLKENIMIVKDEVFANELEDNLELLSLADEESENDENHSVYMSADKTAVVSDFKEVEGELEEKQIEEAPSRGFVFTISESMPEFPGGESARLLFIKENMIYPEDALQNKTEGKVYIQCLIDKNGNIQNIEIAKGISESINAEAIRLIKLMPAWKPAMRDSQAIDAKHVIEIKFELAF
ncbi:MAG: energy transducer TonB, partial [Bacteroidales bacterium]|nr:energy transducer TonB [Bacteroidales bacterium]